jgi:solute carrier family 25 protein 34/35
MLVNALSGGLSGVAGAFVGSPFFCALIEQYLTGSNQDANAVIFAAHGCGRSAQLHGSLAGTDVHLSQRWTAWAVRWRSGCHAAVRALNRFIKPCRTSVGSSIQLSTYDRSRELVVQSELVDDSIAADLGASMISGFFVCLGMNPFDVVSTRMYNQPVDVQTQRGLLYKNLGDCFVKTIRSEGFGALYKGFSAHYLRVGPHTVLFFLFLEQFKRLAKSNGIST